MKKSLSRIVMFMVLLGVAIPSIYGGVGGGTPIRIRAQWLDLKKALVAAEFQSDDLKTAKGEILKAFDAFLDAAFKPIPGEKENYSLESSDAIVAGDRKKLELIVNKLKVQYELIRKVYTPLKKNKKFEEVVYPIIDAMDIYIADINRGLYPNDKGAWRDLSIRTEYQK